MKFPDLFRSLTVCFKNSQIFGQKVPKRWSIFDWPDGTDSSEWPGIVDGPGPSTIGPECPIGPINPKIRWDTAAVTSFGQ